MNRDAVLSDAQWQRISPLLPSSAGRRGRPFRDDRRVVEGIIWRYRVGTPWRDVPRSFGPWQTLWKRHRRYSGDDTWDRVHAELLADADAVGGVDWAVSVDSTINRAHQHATNLPRDTGGALSNYRNLREEPADHALGRSRGGLSTKIHQLVDGRGLPLVIMVTPGQAGDSPMFPVLMNHLRVGRRGPGRPAAAGDGDAQAIVARVGIVLARIVSVLGSTFDPQRVIVSGAIAAGIGEVVTAARRALPTELDLPAPDLLTSELGAEIVVTGAVAAAAAEARAHALDVWADRRLE